jgi:hypothetical protein
VRKGGHLAALRSVQESDMSVEWKQDGEDLVAIGRDREFGGGQTELLRLKGGAAPGVALGPVAVTGKNTVQMLEQQITHADLTDADNGDSQAINIGPVLPAGAVVLGREIEVTTLFSGGGATAVNLVLGGTDPDAIVAGPLDIFTGAATGKLAGSDGVHPQGEFAGEQLAATIDIDAGHNLAGLTAGDLTVRVWYTVNG